MRLPDKTGLLARVRPHRTAWRRSSRPKHIEQAGPGEESVWEYPRPPILAPAPGAIRVMAGEAVIAESDRALEVRETASAPVPYIPPADVRTEWLVENGRLSICEWKGAAAGFDLRLPRGEGDGAIIEDVGWCYPDPFDDLAEGYAAIAGWFAFYPARLACFVVGADGRHERVRPQPGGFYGGWVTGRIRGPIKGAPGSGGW